MRNIKRKGERKMRVVDKLMKQYKQVAFEVFMTKINDRLSQEDRLFINDCKLKMRDIEKQLLVEGIKIR